MIDQRTLEYYMHPKHIKQAIIDDLIKSCPNELNQTHQAVKAWIHEPERFIGHYKNKQLIKDYPLYELIVDIIATVLMNAQKPIPIVSITSAITIPNLPKVVSMNVVAGLLTVISKIPYFRIEKNQSKQGYNIVSGMVLDNKITDRLRLACYLPPMVEKPQTITNNHTSGYLTFNDSVILGFKENQHNKPLALDVLNTLNSTCYELDEYVINNFTKPFHKEELSEDELSLLTKDEQQEYFQQKQTFDNFKGQFETMTKHYKEHAFYFTHKYDKRGRVYSQGYHYNPQGTSFEKACLNLKTKETVIGEL